MEKGASVEASQLEALSSHVQFLMQTVQQLHAQANAGLLPKCPILPPEKFDGKIEEFPAFLAQCKLFIELRDRDFSTDKAKVCFIISLLKGQAAKWFTPLLLAPSPLLNQYQGFLDYMAAAFANPLQAATANRQIRALKQGKDSVSHYSTAFQLLAQDLQWNEAALMDQYLEGLSDEILDELARVDRPDTLRELTTLCMIIHGRLESRRLSKGGTSSQPMSHLASVPVPASSNLGVPEPM